MTGETTIVIPWSMAQAESQKSVALCMGGEKYFWASTGMTVPKWSDLATQLKAGQLSSVDCHEPMRTIGLKGIADGELFLSQILLGVSSIEHNAS